MMTPGSMCHMPVHLPVTVFQGLGPAGGQVGLWTPSTLAGAHIGSLLWNKMTKKTEEKEEEPPAASQLAALPKRVRRPVPGAQCGCCGQEPVWCACPVAPAQEEASADDGDDTGAEQKQDALRATPPTPTTPGKVAGGIIGRSMSVRELRELLETAEFASDDDTVVTLLPAAAAAAAKTSSQSIPKSPSCVFEPPTDDLPPIPEMTLSA
jgi:hypothetical protein